VNERASRSLAPYRRSLIPLPEPASVVDARIGNHGPALLTLEDGSVFPGVSWGAPIASGGDLVMNTSQSGYQEICTDPSYAGQVVLMTYPLIGQLRPTDRRRSEHATMAARTRGCARHRCDQ